MGLLIRLCMVPLCHPPCLILQDQLCTRVEGAEGWEKEIKAWRKKEPLQWQFLLRVCPVRISELLLHPSSRLLPLQNPAERQQGILLLISFLVGMGRTVFVEEAFTEFLLLADPTLWVHPKAAP